MNKFVWITILAALTLAIDSNAQTRDEMVREDRRKVTEDGFWIYNDLDKAFEQARDSGKPILVVLRCIPCHECVKLDDDLVDKDPVIRPLLDQFVCARQVSTNGLDLNQFQYDTDQSFAVFMLNADGTVYGRFGTRSHRTEWIGDVSLPGLAEALEGALALHANYPNNASLLKGKRGPKPEVDSPEQYPSLKAKFTDRLNYQDDVAKSCIHCHQIGEAQRSFYWNQDQPIPQRVLFPYPHPKSLGLILDPKRRSTVSSVAPDSVAEDAGLEAGDEIKIFGGQPPLSIADIQWVLHLADENGATIPITVSRNGHEHSLSLHLDPNWRKASDLSWRVTTWSLRRMVTGGAVLVTLDDEARQEADINPDQMALLVKSVGKYGPHAAAKKAGVKAGDILVSYDGRDDLMTETALIDHAIANRHQREKVSLVVRRGDKKIELQVPIQP